MCDNLTWTMNLCIVKIMYQTYIALYKNNVFVNITIYYCLIPSKRSKIRKSNLPLSVLACDLSDEARTLLLMFLAYWWSSWHTGVSSTGTGSLCWPSTDTLELLKMLYLCLMYRIFWKSTLTLTFILVLCTNFYVQKLK